MRVRVAESRQHRAAVRRERVTRRVARRKARRLVHRDDAAVAHGHRAACDDAGIVERAPRSGSAAPSFVSASAPPAPDAVTDVAPDRSASAASVTTSAASVTSRSTSSFMQRVSCGVSRDSAGSSAGNGAAAADRLLFGHVRTRRGRGSILGGARRGVPAAPLAAVAARPLDSATCNRSPCAAPCWGSLNRLTASGGPSDSPR